MMNDTLDIQLDTAQTDEGELKDLTRQPGHSILLVRRLRIDDEWKEGVDFHIAHENQVSLERYRYWKDSGEFDVIEFDNVNFSLFLNMAFEGDLDDELDGFEEFFEAYKDQQGPEGIDEILEKISTDDGE